MALGILWVVAIGVVVLFGVLAAVIIASERKGKG